MVVATDVSSADRLDVTRAEQMALQTAAVKAGSKDASMVAPMVALTA